MDDDLKKSLEDAGQGMEAALAQQRLAEKIERAEKEIERKRKEREE